jgi:AAA family ATP:ADP antiporter
LNFAAGDCAPDRVPRRTPIERLLGVFTLLRPGEGRCVILFFLLVFLILVAYYILKTLREPLLLVGGSAELKSYAYATIAGILLVLVPVYGFLFRRTGRAQLTRWVTAFFVANLAVFYGLGRAGVDIGFAYYVWVGIVSLMLTAQFWGYAADTFNLKSGQRLFPVIMAGATLGGLLGPLVAGMLYARIGPWNLMLVVCLLLAATLPLVSASRNAVPPGSRVVANTTAPEPHFMGGLAMVFNDRYLLLLALLVVVLNWVNTTGEYILAEFVVRHAAQQVMDDPAALKGEIIATFYSRFYLAVNALAVVIQVLLVSRVFRRIGVKGAILVLPVLAFLAYGLIAFVPLFAVVRFAKIAENSIDYSLMNTTRHALYLPLSEAHKYEGKTAVETFFWRIGDLVQGGVVFAGLHWLDFDVQDFALLNMALAAIWVLVAFRLGRRYQGNIDQHATNRPPALTRPLAGYEAPAGRAFRFSLPADCFVDPDPGDVLRISALLGDGSPLPAWVEFDADTLSFSGIAPADARGHTRLLLRATDFEGASVTAPMTLRHDP